MPFFRVHLTGPIGAVLYVSPFSLEVNRTIPGMPAHGVLLPGDRIVTVNHQIATCAAWRAQFQQTDPLNLLVLRVT